MTPRNYRIIIQNAPIVQIGATIVFKQFLKIESEIGGFTMSTFMANKGNIVRKWYILDAAGKPLGKTAAAAEIGRAHV